jgi:histidyl-tRNA synthetase
LRSAGLKVDTDYMERKMKAQIKAADRLQARYALILGDDELNKGAVLMKDLASGEQQEVEIAHLVETCKKAVKKNLS